MTPIVVLPSMSNALITSAAVTHPHQLHAACKSTQYATQPGPTCGALGGSRVNLTVDYRRLETVQRVSGGAIFIVSSPLFEQLGSGWCPAACH